MCEAARSSSPGLSLWGRAGPSCLCLSLHPPGLPMAAWSPALAGCTPSSLGFLESQTQLSCAPQEQPFQSLSNQPVTRASWKSAGPEWSRVTPCPWTCGSLCLLFVGRKQAASPPRSGDSTGQTGGPRSRFGSV